MTPPVTIDVTAGFVGEVLGSVPIDEATSRIRVYCTSRYSGWAAYDLADVVGDAYFAMLYMLGLFSVACRSPRWRVPHAEALAGVAIEHGCEVRASSEIRHGCSGC